MDSRRKPLIAGNWKMFTDAASAVALAREVLNRCGRVRGCDVAVCPPFPFLVAVARVLEGSAIGLGAQDLSPEDEGAFTGDVSARMLRGVGCGYVIVGHSERREHHLETDDLVRRKLDRALANGLLPILCVGERLQERDAGETFRRIDRQVTVALEGMAPDALARVVVAYEPVWAIGTGRTASPAQAEEVHEFIRKKVAALHGDAAAAVLRILYGGSVKAGNAAALLAERDVDGALVGGASLTVDAFAGIVECVG